MTSAGNHNYLQARENGKQIKKRGKSYQAKGTLLQRTTNGTNIERMERAGKLAELNDRGKLGCNVLQTRDQTRKGQNPRFVFGL